MNKKVKVVNIINSFKVALNVGANDGIKEDYTFLIYELSDDEIIDPDTNKSLGKLEIPKGKGRVTNVQDNLCIIESSQYKHRNIEETSTPGYLTGYLGSGIGSTIKRTEKEQVPFDNPHVGDYAKRVK